MAEKSNKEIEDKKKEAESLLILGIFSMVTGAILFVAIFFSAQASGKIANLLVGIVLFIVGISIYFRGRKNYASSVRK